MTCESQQLSHNRLRFTLVESRMVFSRCAMVKTVLSLKLALMVRWMSASVSPSTDAVASSATSTLGLRSRARATHSSWRCPMLKLSPPSATRAPSPSDSSLTTSCTHTKKLSAQLRPVHVWQGDTSVYKLCANIHWQAGSISARANTNMSNTVSTPHGIEIAIVICSPYMVTLQDCQSSIIIKCLTKCGRFSRHSLACVMFIHSVRPCKNIGHSCSWQTKQLYARLLCQALKCPKASANGRTS